MSDLLDACFGGGDGDDDGLARMFAGDGATSCCKTQLAESNVLRLGGRGGSSGSGGAGKALAGSGQTAAAATAADAAPSPSCLNSKDGPQQQQQQQQQQDQQPPLQPQQQPQQHVALRALDLACGSGEASLALFAWLSRRCQRADAAAAGAAAASAAAPAPPRELHLTAADPFLGPAFRARTGLPRVHTWSFEDVQAGALDGCECAAAAGCSGRLYDVAAVSFALHLLDPTRLHATLSALARASRWLLLLSPHKRPHVDGSSGWRLERHVVAQRVHARLYESQLL